MLKGKLNISKVRLSTHIHLEYMYVQETIKRPEKLQNRPFCGQWLNYRTKCATMSLYVAVSDHGDDVSPSLQIAKTISLIKNGNFQH